MKSVRFKSYFISVIFLVSSVFLFSCGESSDSVSFSGAGDVRIGIEPTNIDVGDRTLVTIRIFKINDDGIIVKVRYPSALSYVRETAVLTVDGDETEVEPDIDADNDGNETFLIFFLQESDFDITREGELTFELQANDSIDEGRIEVDVDVDDPTVLNANEFDSEDPQFQEEDGQDIFIIG